MSLRSNGSYIGPRPDGPSTSVASGIWDLRTVQRQRSLDAWPGQAATDPDFSSVSVLLHMDGSGSAFTDSSSNALAVTAGGSVTQTTTQSKFGGKSAALAVGDYLSVADDSVLAFGTGDLTIEFFLWVTSSGNNQCVIDLRNASNTNQIFLRMTSATNFDLRIGDNSVHTFTANSGQWNHIAIVRSSNTIKSYVGGVEQASSSNSTNLVADGPMLINGFFNATSNGISGYIDELRVTKGVARYTAAFTPPTAAFPNA
jgi:hypothetical protein